MKMRNYLIVILILLGLLVVSTSVIAKKKKFHSFDLFTQEMHEMHNAFFEAMPDQINCETCHKTDDSYARGAHKVYSLSCHLCHNHPKPIMPATSECNLCHAEGFPKPKNHKVGWDNKHQSYAKNNPKYCTQCHANQMFCLDCHKKRDTVEERMHRRNFRFTHSIKARANPRRCDACHTVHFCQECHAGKGTSKL